MGPSLTCYEHYSLADRSAKELEADSENQPPHLLLYGFEGKYPYNITERLTKWPEITTWTVTEERIATEHLYRVTSILKDSEHRVVTFDANKGYLITSVQKDDTKGTKQLDLTLVPARFGEVWVPQQVDKIDDLNGRYFHVRAIATEVNMTLADTEFDMESLDFERKNVTMLRYRSGIAEPTHMVVREGQWIPKKYVKQQAEKLNK